MLQTIIEQMTSAMGGYVPNLIGAFAILFFGWLVALVISALVRYVVRRSGFSKVLASLIWGEKAGKGRGKGIDAERWLGRGVFYLIMLFVLIAFLQTLGLVVITEPINQLLIQVFQYLPRLFAAGLLLLAAWIIASVLRWVFFRGLSATKLDDRLRKSAAFEKAPRLTVTKSISDAVYWLVFLFFLPAVLSTLQMQGILEPVQGMIDKILAFLPNIFVAVFIVLIGWFLARIIQQIVTNLLVVAGTDRLSERIGLAPVLGERRLSGVVGLIVYILILIPVLIASLNAVQLDAITLPASNMLNIMLAALPAIFAALLLVAIAFIVARVIARLITNVLTGAGFNFLFVKLGLSKEAVRGKWTPSFIAGYIALVVIVLFATIEALRLLNFVVLADLVAQFLVFTGRVILGLIIFGFGLFLANLAARAVQAAGTDKSGLLALVARISIIVLAAAMALTHMNVGNDIIIIAFGMALGAVAIAAAIAFGIGGRDIAAQQLRKWTGVAQPRTARSSGAAAASRRFRASKRSKKTRR
ncbi:MAG: hypothetical protein A2Z19_00390 [Deltaproteobacteria bacterium RBG_16_54_18]|nr:MAG: hypothetical protein A2Z19_00390 [Deltaproteobacteria bacterium RBG_16_54_18]